MSIIRISLYPNYHYYQIYKLLIEKGYGMMMRFIIKLYSTFIVPIIAVIYQFQHLTPSQDIHPIITSLMRFHVFFTIRRKLRRLDGNEKMSHIYLRNSLLG